MMLVIAPRPYPTESLMGYVLRLTEINGYPSISYVLSGLGHTWYQTTVGRLDAKGLVSLTGIGKADIERLTHMPADQPRAYIRVFGIDLPNYEVTLTRPKVCPFCLAEGRPCEAFWDLAQSAVCPVHCVALVTHCSSCGKKLTWSRTKIRQCKCGAKLSEASTVPANPEVCDLMAFMRYLVYQDVNLAQLPESMSHLAHLNLRRFCKLIWVFSSVFQSQDGRIAPKSRSHYKIHLESVARTLLNWPFGFREFLSEQYMQKIENAKELPHFRSLFRWLLIRLVKNDDEDGSAYAFLERELYLFGANYWTRNAMAREGVSLEMMPKNFKWGTLAEAGDIAGLHQMTLKKRIDAGEIKIKKIRINSGRAIVVDLYSIQDQPLSQYLSVSIRDAAREVGVSIETFKILRANGVFEENYRSVFPGSLAREDLNPFAEKLRQLGSGKRAISATGVTTLNETFIKWTASPKEKAGLFVRLLNDSTLIVGKKPGRSLNCLQVMEAMVTAYFRSVRKCQSECLSNANTALRLGCFAAVVTRLIKDGHIEAREQHGRKSPCLTSVIKFDKKFMVIARMSEKLGVTAKSIYARVDFSTIDHIKVNVPAHKTIFVARTEVSKIKKNMYLHPKFTRNLL